jgi:hypothetical protein
MSPEIAPLLIPTAFRRAKLPWKIIEDKSIPDNLKDMRAYLSGLGLE